MYFTDFTFLVIEYLLYIGHYCHIFISSFFKEKQLTSELLGPEVTEQFIVYFSYVLVTKFHFIFCTHEADSNEEIEAGSGEVEVTTDVSSSVVPDCTSTLYGCCPDGRTPRQVPPPSNEGCLVVTADITEYNDDVTPMTTTYRETATIHLDPIEETTEIPEMTSSVGDLDDGGTSVAVVTEPPTSVEMLQKTTTTVSPSFRRKR